MKKILLYILAVFIAVRLILPLIKAAVFLYFGIATAATTLLFYILIFFACVGVIIFFKRTLKWKVDTNHIVLFFSVWLSLLAGEFILKDIVKKNLTYSERLGGPYYSSYSYLDGWVVIKKYLLAEQNFWFLHGKPNSVKISEIESHKFQHRFNSMGLRDKELMPMPEDTANLIIGIGDSFTEGIGTAQDSTWLKFLERDINACSSQKIKTLNAGAQGSDVFFEYLLLEKKLEHYHPHMVIVSINSTDIDDIIFKGGRNRFKPDGRLEYNKPPYWEKLYAVSYIFRAIKHTTSNLHWTLLTQEEHEKKANQSIDSIQLCVERFQQLAKQKGFKLAVVFHPTVFEIKSGNFPLAGLAAKLSADTSITVINVHDEFRKSGIITPTNADEFYWKTDLHHNTRGYKAMGDAVAARLNYCD